MSTVTDNTSAATALVDGFFEITSPSRQRLTTLVLSLLSVALGVVAGFGAFGFRALIAVVHNLFFLGRISSEEQDGLSP